jgi:lipopolysaccharide export system protein LptA
MQDDRFIIGMQQPKYNLFLILLLVLLSPGQNDAIAQEPQQIEYDADDILYDKGIASGAYRLINHVVFRHKNTIMYCDSAYFYAQENSLEAFENVHINQGDSVQIYGDYLYYDGNTRMARIRKNVKLSSSSTKLTSQAVDYDLHNNYGYYDSHADIVSGENKLQSRVGYYYSRQNMYQFRDSVVVENPEYTIYSDTLKYNTVLNTAYFIGPTRIISDSNTIYCERGWYNTEKNISLLKNNASIENRTQTLTGDSLYYERETGHGEAYSHIQLVDKEQNIILRGNYARMNEIAETALLTDSALLIYMTEDDSIFVHADTLRSEPDSLGKKQLRLYYRVKMFKADLQGKCDSLYYSSSDSILRFFHSPVLWSEDFQLSAEYIELHIKNRKVHQLLLQRTAFIIQQEDTSRFNQVKGKNMICHFRDNELYKINVYGNGQTIYYAKDKEDYLGVNMAESSDLIIFLVNKKLEEIRFIKQPSAVLYPLEKAPREELLLKDFKWQIDARPIEKEDIFIWNEEPENKEESTEKGDGEKNEQGTRKVEEAN